MNNSTPLQLKQGRTRAGRDVETEGAGRVRGYWRRSYQVLAVVGGEARVSTVPQTPRWSITKFCNINVMLHVVINVIQVYITHT